MPDQTKRGEHDRRREGEVMAGEPVEAARPADAAARPAPTTRDKSAPPADDPTREEREGHR